jgi:hypothetical protein
MLEESEQGFVNTTEFDTKEEFDAAMARVITAEANLRAEEDEENG